MKKKMGNFTAGNFKNYKQSVEELFNKDQGFHFMNQIRGTPAYWKKFQYEVLAIIKQLGCPTFFLTLSCAYSKQKEIPEIISKLSKLNLSKEYLESMNYFLNPPKLSEETLRTYIEFIDNTTHANLPAPDDDPVLCELVNQYQTHKHSKCCRKYKNKLCRYGFGKIFTEKTIIPQQLEDGTEDAERYSVLRKKGYNIK